MKEQAEALFDEARAATGENKAKAASIEVLIKEAKTFESRGGVGGPRTITRVLNPGETHTYPVAFFSGQPAAVAMTSSGPPRIQFDITHVGGNNLFSLKGLNAGYNWTPQRDRDNVRRFTITLTNMGVRATTYTLTAN